MSPGEGLPIFPTSPPGERPDCPSLRASDEHSFIVRVLRARRTALLLFLSVLLHELGHSYVALRYQIPIRQITLFIFGGVAHMGKEPPSPRAEFLIAIAGPLVSLILGAGCLGGAMAMESLFARSGLRGLIVLGSLLGMVNVQLGLFNLIPGFPLDGGRVLRAGLWA
ncbi:MAG: hypothetical protein E6K66_11530, partial [Nitrospirae bacterium]